MAEGVALRALAGQVAVSAERVGFVPREPAPINGLGAIGNARTAQIHSNPEYEVQNRYSARARSSRVQRRSALPRHVRVCLFAPIAVMSIGDHAGRVWLALPR